MSQPPRIHIDKPPVEYQEGENFLSSTMCQETDVARSTGVLKKPRIAKGEGTAAIAQTKTVAQNSLLNISTRIPPEILGYIFVWTIAHEENDSMFYDSTFIGLENRSHSFLFVCRRWFKVASNTPGLWTFWGNTLKDWKRLCRFNKVVPVDLVLDVHRASGPEVLSDSLLDELRDRVTRDKIRQIHLKGKNPNLLGSILSSLTPDEEGAQEKHIESIILDTEGTHIPEELINLFARSHLPWLRCLRIAGGLSTPSWDHLISQTTRLITLSLKPTKSSIPLTTSQLNSILVMNPHLQYLTLLDAWLPDEGESGVRVPLHRLRKISLTGEFHSVFRLLKRLVLPVTLEHTDLHVKNSPLEGIYQTLGPYIRGLFQHDVWSQSRLEVYSSVYREVDIYVGTREASSKPGLVVPSARFSIAVIDSPPTPVLNKLSCDLMAFIPQEQMEFWKIGHTLEAPEELLIAMPKLTDLYLTDVVLSDGFLQPNPNGQHAGKRLLPSLQYLDLSDVTVEDSNWQPLIHYLAHQSSDGQPISLVVESRFDMLPEVRKEIRGLVEHLEYNGYTFESGSTSGDGVCLEGEVRPWQ